MRHDPHSEGLAMSNTTPRVCRTCLWWHDEAEGLSGGGVCGIRFGTIQERKYETRPLDTCGEWQEAAPQAPPRKIRRTMIGAYWAMSALSLLAFGLLGGFG